MRFSLVFVAIVCLIFTNGEDVRKHILVLMDNVWVKDTHSQFLSSLVDRGYTTTVRLADDPNMSLVRYGEYIYGTLIILAPSVVVFGGSLNTKNIVQFLDEGGNLVVVASSDVGGAIRELGSECGVEFDEIGSAVIDHQKYDIGDDGMHTRVVVDEKNLVNIPVVTGGVRFNPFLYKGVGISSEPTNPLLINILHASRNAYTYNPEKPVTDYPNAVGTNTQLIVGLQARNNARALFIGSLEFLSNKYFDSHVKPVGNNEKSTTSGNKDLVNNLLPWVLGERGQLRVAYVKHHLEADLTTPAQYTILDNVQYTIKIETKNESQQWIPYDSDDVQLEFVRIDPFVRRTLMHQGGVYSTVLKLPDVYGVFKFVVDYHRTGYTHLQSITQVPVRPFTHTQYERFIPAAYPYYVSAISMVVGTVLFSFVFLYYKDEGGSKQKAE